MRKLVLILIAFIAVVTFIRAYDQRQILQNPVMEKAPEIMVNNIDSK